MRSFIKGDIYSDKEDFAQFDPGMGEAFDIIKITDNDEVLNLYLTRKQTETLLRDMLNETPLLAVAERIIKEAE